MHFLVASLIFCALLLRDGYAKDEKGFRCNKNVPKIAKEALLNAINEERSMFEIASLKEEDYDCDLAMKASQSIAVPSTLILEGQSKFENFWNETLKNALMSQNNGKTNVAEKIGCKITLTTSKDDGSHSAELYCLIDNGKVKTPR
uniref:Salivary secreted peptide n=1 Tax=Haemonchus contortus TaxID=6289 RepID=A0A7I4XZI0_HAECO|nr:activation associated secreted protein [Haemonchus contortus]